MVKLGYFRHEGTRGIKCGSFSGGVDGEYNGVRVVEISEIFVTQGVFFFGAISFDRVLYFLTQFIVPHDFK